ncbi:MAG: hypothetical protein KIT33_13795 [Candidatus Kapabacteria bacterium]|nr:hypothetical protein [Ignavibacteriota bacterium]MCW5886038.1 hypothetical protein [Candidatus Kapabacteria bacterium]
MDKKQLFTAVAILLGTFVLLIGTFVGIYYLYPELLGFAPKKDIKAQLAHKTDDKKKKDGTDSLAISSEESDTNEVILTYDSLKLMTNALKDSLEYKNLTVKVYSDSISALVKRIVEFNDIENQMRDSVKLLKNQMSKVLVELRQTRELVNDTDSLRYEKLDSLNDENIQKFAKIYNNTGPAEVAKILERLDGKDAARILKLMQPKKAGKVLESMKPEFAAEILLKGNY